MKQVNWLSNVQKWKIKADPSNPMSKEREDDESYIKANIQSAEISERAEF